jgi:hypothetical protein
MELTSELHKALAAAWAAFTMGMLIFHAYRHCPHGWLLSRLLLFLSPAILSGYGIHSVQVCNQILAAKQGETVDDRIYLASVTRADLGDGIIYTTERYSDGTKRTSGQMRVTKRRDEGDLPTDREADEGAADSRGSLVPMQVRNQPIKHGADYRASVF